MPFTRISLHAGKQADYLTAICDSLDRALVASFEVPQDDQFVAIHQMHPGELIFNRIYRGGPRSDDFVHFHITTGRNRSPASKSAFFKTLTDNLAIQPGIRPQDVMITIVNSTFEDWSFAEGQSAELRQDQ